MPEQTKRIEGRDGLRGTLHVPSDGQANATIELDTGQRLAMPMQSLIPREDGSYFLPLSLEDLSRAEPSEPVVVPVAREELHVEKQRREAAQVVVHITPHVRQEVVELGLAREQVEVERVAINRPVDEPGPVRQEGEVTIVPVFEEVLVVRKQLMLKEEIHIRRHHITQTEQREVALRSEEAHVLRSEAPGENRPPPLGK